MHARHHEALFLGMRDGVFVFVEEPAAKWAGRSVRRVEDGYEAGQIQMPELLRRV